jgi:hypothetical protein
MPVDPAIVTENNGLTSRLATLVARLSDADLTRDLGEGWTVAVSLAHAAFWDRRAVLVFERWVREGTPYRDQDDDILNTALLAEWQALPPRRAAELAVEAARSVDATIAVLPDNVVAAVIAQGDDFLLRRSGHRREHVEQVEAALSATP